MVITQPHGSHVLHARMPLRSLALEAVVIAPRGVAARHARAPCIWHVGLEMLAQTPQDFLEKNIAGNSNQHLLCIANHIYQGTATREGVYMGLGP
mmetsp:Transcript_11869/g.24748  ORF Transcript_11869/g.24748 Transcript_11869/m.24748 type:complete len:95 (-) Transcript_11869:144-428(-)